MERKLSDAELVALSALLSADVAHFTMENEARVSQGKAAAYSNFQSDTENALRDEMKRRGLIPE